MSDSRTTPSPRTFRERFGALKTLRPFMAMVWQTSPSLTMALLGLRVLRALLPVVSLYIGKLIIDDVVMLLQLPNRPVTWQGWRESGHLTGIGILLLAEFALAVLSDGMARVVALLDGMLAEKVTNRSSVRLMEHAATLDLEDFEDAEFQDQLDSGTKSKRTVNGQRGH